MSRMALPCLTTSREHQALAAQERQRWRLSRRLARARGVDKPAAVAAQTRAAAPSFSAVLPTAADKLAPARAASLEPHRWLGCRVCSTSARKRVLQRSQRDARTTRRHPSARQPTLTARSRRARTRPPRRRLARFVALPRDGAVMIIPAALHPQRTARRALVSSRSRPLQSSTTCTRARPVDRRQLIRAGRARTGARRGAAAFHRNTCAPPEAQARSARQNSRFRVLDARAGRSASNTTSAPSKRTSQSMVARCSVFALYDSGVGTR